MKILIVEDHSDVSSLVSAVFHEEGHVVDTAENATEGLLLARIGEYDAIVLDVGLPDRNGLELLRELRRDRRTIPVLIVTGRNTNADAVLGLDAGADDYLTKPFDLGVLKARMRALLRRGGPTRGDTMTVGNVVLNRLTRKVLAGGSEVTLTVKEYGLLELLLARADEVVPRSAILEHVWERNRDPDSNVIDAMVARVRRKLRQRGASVRLETVRGVGFRLIASD